MAGRPQLNANQECVKAGSNLKRRPVKPGQTWSNLTVFWFTSLARHASNRAKAYRYAFKKRTKRLQTLAWHALARLARFKSPCRGGEQRGAHAAECSAASVFRRFRICPKIIPRFQAISVV